MSASTPIARSKTAALSRVLDSIPKGYTRYTCGEVAASKAIALATKFNAAYAIGATPAQRLARKSKGRANSLLVMYWPEFAEKVEWLLISTPGNGLEGEILKDVKEKPRPLWLGYELVRRAERGKTAWTWRRPKNEMAELYGLLDEQLTRHHHSAVMETLRRIAKQPGFHGVREQSWQLSQFARQRGFPGELPFLFYVQKVSHGDKLKLYGNGG